MNDANFPRHPLAVLRTEPSEGLCQSCGLCCNGTIFTQVPLAVDEVGPMQSLGFRVHDENRPHFDQPCPKLDSANCTIYAYRPTNCRDYRCRVLQRIDTQELTLQAARELVTKATTIRSYVDALLPQPSDGSQSIWARLDEFANTDSADLPSSEFSKRHAHIAQHATALKDLIDREFRTSKLRALSGRMDDLST